MDEQKIKNVLDARTMWVLAGAFFIGEHFRKYNLAYKELSDEEKRDAMRRLCWGEEV